MRAFRGSPSGNTVCRAVTVNYDPPNVAGATGAYDVIATITGAQTRQRCVMLPEADISTPGYLCGLMSYISAANTVRFQNANVTAGALNPAALNITILIFGDQNLD